MKERIIKKFEKSNYTELGEIDNYIVDIIKEINSYPNIMTEMSCEGHFIPATLPENGEFYHSTPYVTFLVDDKGWDIFWNICAPKLLVGTIIRNKENCLGTIFYSRIQINDFIDENGIDYGSINIYGSDNEEYKELFWDKIKDSFKCFNIN